MKFLGSEMLGTTQPGRSTSERHRPSVSALTQLANSPHVLVYGALDLKVVLVVVLVGVTSSDVVYGLDLKVPNRV